MSDLEPIHPEDAVAMYLDSREDEVSEQTLGTHRRRLKHFLAWCDEEGVENLNDVTGRDLHSFRVWLSTSDEDEEDLAPATISSRMSTVRVFCQFAASINAVPEGLPDKIMIPSVSRENSVSDSTMDPKLAEDILDYLDRYEYASRNHVIMALLWRTGMRSGALRALDVRDLDLDEPALKLNHRPDTGTTLKNQERGERWVALDERLARMLEDYLEGPRIEKTDDYGRHPLISTRQGRASNSTIRDTIYRLSRPCQYPGRECPHDRDPDECEAMGFDRASKCPSARSPHDLRSGAITSHLLDDVPTEIVSDRMDVSPDVLDKHYDRRDERAKMRQRRRFLTGGR